jgi:6-phosphogluconolactonase
VDRKAGSLSHFQTVATSEKTKTDAADIHITSDGKFLYSTNRADLNEIVCFAVDSKTGTLTRNGRYPTNGRGPRNFMISANNKYILIAHQYTNNITVFKVNPSDGSLTDTGNSVKMHSPVCITKL